MLKTMKKKWYGQLPTTHQETDPRVYKLDNNTIYKHEHQVHDNPEATRNPFHQTLNS